MSTELAYLNASMTFCDCPLVDMPIKISPHCPTPCTCLKNTFSYPKSFAIAVSVETFVFKHKAGNARLFFKNFPENSAARCC